MSVHKTSRGVATACILLVLLLAAGCAFVPPSDVALDVGGGVRLGLIRVSEGQFMMGSPETDEERYSDEQPQHVVTLTKPFYMGVTEVTQAQWTAVMNTEPWKGRFNSPEDRCNSAANYITWHDAEAFCKALSSKVGRSVRLPTEAEWEYACRAGTTTRFHLGDGPDYRIIDSEQGRMLREYAWHTPRFADGGGHHVHRVARKRPNPWGLYDMYGNVQEWCSDWYADSYAPGAGETADARDPQGPEQGTRPPSSWYNDSEPRRVVRGGAYSSSPEDCRSARRNWRSISAPPEAYYGFRIVVEINPAGS